MPPSRPASSPSIRRMVVPEFPQSRIPGGSWRPLRPTPCTLTISPAAISDTSTPMALRQVAVLRGSSAGSKPSISVVPSAIAPNKRARWEIDLSPGTRMVPRKFAAPPSIWMHSAAIGVELLGQILWINQASNPHPGPGLPPNCVGRKAIPPG